MCVSLWLVNLFSCISLMPSTRPRYLTHFPPSFLLYVLLFLTLLSTVFFFQVLSQRSFFLSLAILRAHFSWNSTTFLATDALLLTPPGHNSLRSTIPCYHVSHSNRYRFVRGSASRSVAVDSVQCEIRFSDIGSARLVVSSPIWQSATRSFVHLYLIQIQFAGTSCYIFSPSLSLS